MKATGHGDGFKNPEPGTVNAVCTRMIDLGTQETQWQGKPKRARKVMLVWEVDQKMEDERPFIVIQRYTLSIHPKSILGQHLESWRGVAFTDDERDGFDIAKVLGQGCLLTLVKEGEYVNIKSVARLPKGMARLEPHGPLVLFDLDNYSGEAYGNLSENLRNTIAKSPEWKKATGQAPAPDGAGSKGADDDSIPF